MRILFAVFLLLTDLSAEVKSFKKYVAKSDRSHKLMATRSLDVKSYSSSSGYTSVMIVPTGIGAAIGGYAGDALPSCRLLSAVTDTLITHPNVMNGAMLYWPVLTSASDRGYGLQYVEGFALDEFASGRIVLAPRKKRGHKIGLILDKGIEPELRVRHTQVRV